LRLSSTAVLEKEDREKLILRAGQYAQGKGFRYYDTPLVEEEQPPLSEKSASAVHIEKISKILRQDFTEQIIRAVARDRRLMRNGSLKAFYQGRVFRKEGDGLVEVFQWGLEMIGKSKLSIFSFSEHALSLLKIFFPGRYSLVVSDTGFTEFLAGKLKKSAAFLEACRDKNLPKLRKCVFPGTVKNIINRYLALPCVYEKEIKSLVRIYPPLKAFTGVVKRSRRTGFDPFYYPGKPLYGGMVFRGFAEGEGRVLSGGDYSPLLVKAGLRGYYGAGLAIELERVQV